MLMGSSVASSKIDWIGNCPLYAIVLSRTQMLGITNEQCQVSDTSIHGHSLLVCSMDGAIR
jgi:hypothetical protein